MTDQAVQEDVWAQYAQVLRRMPGVRWVQIGAGAGGRPLVQVVADPHPQPGRFVREIVSALRTSGWADVTPEMISVAHVPVFPESEPDAHRPQLMGYGISQGPDGVRAECRLGWRGQTLRGEARGACPLEAMAEAAVMALNQGRGAALRQRLQGVATVRVGGAEVVVVTVGVGADQVSSGSAVLEGSPEEAAVRAVLAVGWDGSH
ncbi:MAG: hypothetical protein K6U14_08830 [Firmicutes bacterium]|nr:hypothetical protein [Alicyclobacillaceae bacterium]MCL6497714.1 hypothetical protein [Bacillota bacterium]